MTAEVVKLNSPIENLVLEIRGHVHDAGRAESTCAKHQLRAGLLLIELRAQIERDGGDWWAFFDEKFTGYIKTRKYAEKLMRWARSDDPEAALDAERERVRKAVRKSRSLRNDQNENEEHDIVADALQLVARMSEEERQRFDEAYRGEYQ